MNLYCVHDQLRYWFYIGTEEMLLEYKNILAFGNIIINSIMNIKDISPNCFYFLYSFLEDKFFYKDVLDQILIKIKVVLEICDLFESNETIIFPEEENEQCHNSTLVIYNKQFLKCIVYKKTNLSEKTLKYSFDCDILKSYSFNQHPILYDFFLKNHFFESQEILIVKLKLFEDLYDLDIESDKTIVTNFMEKNYQYSCNPKDKIKANTLLSHICNILGKHKKKIIQNLLENIGFIKKRFQDGYYYINIKPYTKNITELQSLRDKELDELKLTFD